MHFRPCYQLCYTFCLLLDINLSQFNDFVRNSVNNINTYTQKSTQTWPKNEPNLARSGSELHERILTIVGHKMHNEFRNYMHVIYTFGAFSFYYLYSLLNSNNENV